MTSIVPNNTPPGSSEWTQGRAQELVLMAATVVGVYASYRLVLPFVPAFAWALTLAVLFAPVHRWNEARVKRSNIAAGISVVMVGAIVIVPGILVAGRLIEEVARAMMAITAAIDSGQWQQAMEGHPRIAPLVGWMGRQVDLPALIGSAVAWLTNTSASLVRGSIVQTVVFVLTFYFLFYFLRDRRAAFAAVLDLSPLSEPEMGKITARVADAIHATFYGTLVCAAVQGTLGGLMFWWLGLPAPLLWGVIMGLLAIVPVFGAFVVWIPAAAFLALDGHWVKALILTVWGSVVIAGIDNVLYPMLVGNRLRLHTVPAFVAVVGGLAVFGASGVILGPLAVTITLTLLEIWRARASQRSAPLKPGAPPSWQPERERGAQRQEHERQRATGDQPERPAAKEQRQPQLHHRVRQHANGDGGGGNGRRDCLRDASRHRHREGVHVREPEYRRGGDHTGRPPPLPREVHSHQDHLKDNGHLKRPGQLERITRRDVWRVPGRRPERACC